MTRDKKFWLMILALAIAFLPLKGWAMRGNALGAQELECYGLIAILNWNAQLRRRRLLAMKGAMLRVFQALMCCVQAALGATVRPRELRKCPPT